MKWSNLHTASSKNTAKRWVVLFVAYICLSLSTFAANHFVSSSQLNVDGNSLNIQPGDTIFLEAGNRPHLRFVNINGNADNYITIINSGGAVVVSTETHYFGVVITQSSFFRFTGTGSANETYGIKILKTPAKANGLSIDGRSTDYEIDHIEIANTGFAGIFAFTAPNCDGTNNRESFVQRNTVFRNNYIHNTFGEGMYIGHSFHSGFTLKCDGVDVKVLPHEIQGLRIFNNIIENTGWDGMQVSSASVDCEIFNNSIINYGLANVNDQNYGLLIGGGTTGKCYNNLVMNGSGNGINVLGIGNNILYNNVIVNAGNNVVNNPNNKIAVFFDDRGTIAGSTFHFINNTIINPNGEAVRFNSRVTRNNVIANNLVVNPGAYANIKDKSKAFFNISTQSSVSLSNNSTHMIEAVHLPANNLEAIYEFSRQMSVHNAGMDVSAFGIDSDFFGTKRFLDVSTDIGAFEYNQPIENMRKQSPFTAFPNPTKGDFEVKTESFYKLDRVSVKTLNGVMLYDFVFNENFNPNIQLNDMLKRGVYIVEYVSGIERYTDKLIIN